MLNRMILMGRLTKDPELRTTPTGSSVTTITLACERDFARAGEQKETDFIDVVCWNQRAEFVSKYFRKGQLVAAEGRLQGRKWVDKAQQNRVSLEVIADNVFFAESKKDSYSAPAQSLSEAFGNHQPSITAEQAQSFVSGFEQFADDDDVPF